MLDIGCANGELIYYLKKNFKNLSFSGACIRDDLLKIAKQRNAKDVNFTRIDFNKKLNLKKKFDIIIFSGVISIFDDLNIFFRNIKKLSKPNTIIYIGGFFNIHDYDVIIKYKDLSFKKDILQDGWNIWSIKTIKDKFKNKKFKKYNFNIKFDVPPNKKDLIRSWTIKVGKRRLFTNALNILQDHYWLELS